MEHTMKKKKKKKSKTRKKNSTENGKQVLGQKFSVSTEKRHPFFRSVLLTPPSPTQSFGQATEPLLPGTFWWQPVEGGGER